jgi:Tfp pilus assembly protein PilO
MSGRTKSWKWKLAVKIALGCVLAVDGALLVVNWRTASADPKEQAAELVRLKETQKLLTDDVQKGREIAKRLPGLENECDAFYQKDLLPSSSGYASVIADIGELAKTAGVETSGLGFHPTEIKDRGLTQVQLTGAVQGDYASLIRLIDEIERSPHFYLLEGLSLTSENSGVIKLQVNLRTYFRT